MKTIILNLTEEQETLLAQTVGMVNVREAGSVDLYQQIKDQLEHPRFAVVAWSIPTYRPSRPVPTSRLPTCCSNGRNP